MFFNIFPSLSVCSSTYLIYTGVFCKKHKLLFSRSRGKKSSLRYAVEKKKKSIFKKSLLAAIASILRNSNFIPKKLLINIPLFRKTMLPINNLMLKSSHSFCSH